MNELIERLKELDETAGHVARQTNPMTGAPLPQPLIGFGSATVNSAPPTPGQLSRGR